MSTEIIKQYENSILELEQVKKNRILTDKRLNKLEKDCDEIKKNCDEIREYIKKCYIKHFLKLSL